MIVFGIAYLLLLLMALLFQLAIKRKNKDKASGQSSWGKFIVFALIAPVIMSVYFLFPQFQEALHLTIGLLSISELAIQLTKRNTPIWITFLSLIGMGLIGFSFWNLVRPSTDFSSNQLASVYFTVVIFDSYSQLTGQMFGKRKLFPRISPNKTIGGLIFGMVATLVSISLLALFTDHFALSLTSCVAVLFLAFVGDTSASLIKRKLGIKDFSKLMPYQGGVLDRFDSYLIASLTLPIFSLLHINI